MRAWPSSLLRSISLYKTHVARLSPQKGDRVVVAMSGGVDSSVVAKLLADKDYDLSAVYMRNWDTRDESGTDSGCEWKKDWADVQRVCRRPVTGVLDASFRASSGDLEKGGTPNPDIWCNREVKFGALLDHITPKDSWLATGHYADKAWFPHPSLASHIFSSNITTPRPQLMRPADRTKDQTYYLSSISEAALARALFPIAKFKKTEVREMAQRWGLPTAQREESMGICFVGEKQRFNDFISQYIPPNPGLIIDLETGKTLTTHQGLWSYTVGQGARIRGMPQKMFVAKKDPVKNEIYVVPGSDHPALSCNSIWANEWEWIWKDSPPAGIEDQGFRARMQFRHRMLDVPCVVRRRSVDGMIHITFQQPQTGIAQGQVAAVWEGNWCLGCGVIVETE
ncbi:tRNA-specific 2-thiouridylase MnmA [Grifola frondosa]|uniref:tRNA-5-taurinomethyluridine 2-sulfurtransferase n=1 Tax=Grifola frondosa TaxID=5627 RepID=A0A1C7LLR4_GRIFR|nr:tRNA-specific 2-thiouridylase MnmA [Grifola frondosa]